MSRTSFVIAALAVAALSSSAFAGETNADPGLSKLNLETFSAAGKDMSVLTGTGKSSVDIGNTQSDGLFASSVSSTGENAVTADMASEVKLVGGLETFAAAAKNKLGE